MENEIKEMKGGEGQMETIEVKMKRYLDKCPFCGKEISNYTPEAVRYNMMIHMDVCDENPNNKRENTEPVKSKNGK